MSYEIANKIPIQHVIGRSMSLFRSGERYYRGEKHNSLVIDLKTNRFYWNSEGESGGPLDWLMSIEGMKYDAAMTILGRMVGFNHKREPEISMPAPVYSKLLSIFYNLGKHNRGYWHERGYLDNTIEYFKLGYTGNHYVVPIVVDGKLENFQCRVKRPNHKAVWMWARGKPPCPFNMDHKNTSWTFLLEGPTDAIAMTQLGFPAISQTGGAGCWKKEWNKYIIDYDKIIVFYDKDFAGVDGSKTTAARLLNRGHVLFWPSSFPPKYDVNKCMQDYGIRGAKDIISGMLPWALHINDVDMNEQTRIAQEAINKIGEDYEVRNTI